MVTGNITNGSSAQFSSFQLPVAGPTCKLCINSKGNVKFTLERAMKTQSEGVYVYLYSFFNLGASWG